MMLRARRTRRYVNQYRHESEENCEILFARREGLGGNNGLRRRHFQQSDPLGTGTISQASVSDSRIP